MTANDVRELLSKIVEEAGGREAWGNRHGISGEYVRLIMNGHREPAGIILKALGLERVITYQKVP